MSLSATAPLTAAEEADLITRAQAGDSDATAALVTSQLRWLRSTAVRYARAGTIVDVDDLVSAGIEAFLTVLASFDPAGTARLHTAASAEMYEAIRVAAAGGSAVPTPIRTRRKYLRAMRATAGSVSAAREWARTHEDVTAETFDAVHSAESAWSGYGDATTVENGTPFGGVYEDPASAAVARDTVRSALASLNPRQRRVIELTVLADAPMTVREAAEALGVTHPTVLRDREAALTILRHVIA